MGIAVTCQMVNCCSLSDRDGRAEDAFMTFGWTWRCGHCHRTECRTLA